MVGSNGRVIGSWSVKGGCAQSHLEGLAIISLRQCIRKSSEGSGGSGQVEWAKDSIQSEERSTEMKFKEF